MFFIYMNLSVLMFFFFLVSFMMFLKFLILKMNFFIEISVMKFFKKNFTLILYLDYKSFMFLMVVLLISSMIVIYSLEYMSEDKFGVRFIYLLMMFVFSMLLMILGQNLLMILLGWDGLGLISYCLVIYYNNWNSYNSGMITVLTNRLGDIGLLISIGMLSVVGDWNYLFFPFFSKLFFFFMIMLACFTKSAQIPFSSWLPMAMAAPTPISALVHSSTLVTAGVYLMFRLEKLIFSLNLKNFMVMISLMTMFFSGVNALFENDFKKIIALSTLSQLGLMMMSLILGLKLMSFFHLIIHALFKSLLFMCAGLILHSTLNNQDIRFMGSMGKSYFVTLMMFNSSSLALCGFPFMSGFYSKDLILDLSIFLNLNYFVLMMFYFSIMLTVVYSFRLIFYMLNNFFKFFSYQICSDLKLMNLSMIILFICSIISGSLFNWFLFNSLVLVNLSILVKLFVFVLIIISIFIGLNMSLFMTNMKMSQIFKFVKSMWMMNYFGMFYSTLVLGNSLLILEMENVWDKVMDDSLFGYFYMKMMILDYINYKNFIYYFFLMMLFFYLII
uniref:NADH-ubiquinone oxidoreductase chain 5 n=1 Tax=Idris sp. MM-2013 TaxID=1429433 RepID=A0A067YFA2_9HYME|nr:NADH dehydrogenase subunit 5 [Idris sp. MM-2013]